MRQICFLIFISCISPALAQDSHINIHGKTYTITGDNLTIVVGKDPLIRIKHEVPQKVKDAIAGKYRGAIQRLEQQKALGLLTEQKLNDSIEVALQNRNTALDQAQLLVEAFDRTDPSKETYLYRLAYVLFLQGDIDGALAVLDDHDLDQLEQCQAVLYILRAETHSRRGELEEARKKWREVSFKYPSFMTLAGYGDFLYRNVPDTQALVPYRQALAFCSDDRQRAYILSAMAFLFYTAGAHDSTSVYLRLGKMTGSPEDREPSVPPDCYLSPGLYRYAPALTQARLLYLKSISFSPAQMDSSLTYLLRANEACTADTMLPPLIPREYGRFVSELGRNLLALSRPLEALAVLEKWLPDYEPKTAAGLTDDEFIRIGLYENALLRTGNLQRAEQAIPVSVQHWRMRWELNPERYAEPYSESLFRCAEMRLLLKHKKETRRVLRQIKPLLGQFKEKTDAGTAYRRLRRECRRI